MSDASGQSFSTDGLAERLAAEGLSAGSWSNAPGDTYGAHSHSYDKVLVAAAGSITFHLVRSWPRRGVARR